eukprot:SAG31_NODE_47158_length_251_cov_1.013158_1_plen_44_part_01
MALAINLIWSEFGLTVRRIEQSEPDADAKRVDKGSIDHGLVQNA